MKEFEAVDTECTGLISQVDLQALVKKLNPDFTADEFKQVFAKLKVVDGKVKFKDFVDLFIGGTKNVLNPTLAKPLSDGELADLKAVFGKYDKDGSGQIDLRELQTMCEALGKKLPDEQAAIAMQQLDKDGNLQCNFEEFLLWYTCTPGAGGYSHVALSFMKAQLAMKGGIRKVAKRAKKTIENVDEFVFRGCIDLSPDTARPSKEAMSASFTVRKTGAATNACPRATAQLTAKDPDTAASLIALLEALFKNPDDPFPVPITMRQEKDKIFISMEADAEMFGDEGLGKGLGFLEECTKKMDGKISFGSSFADIVKNQDRPLLLHFQGAKVEGDVNIGLTALVNFFAKSDVPPEMTTALKVLAAVTKDTKICYNESSIMKVATKIKEATKARADSSPYRRDMIPGLSDMKAAQWAMSSLKDLRTNLYAMAKESGIINESSKFESPKPKVVEVAFQLIRELGAGIVSCDEIVFDGIPGSTVQFVITFDQVNPFPLIAYVFGGWPNDPNGGGKDTSLNRPQSDAETDRLREAFKKYDKDGSGAIDLKELGDMIKELGGKMTDEEILEAMKQLDTNKDGTCSFEEFKELWSSKSGLGGYSSLTLKFLKAKLTAGSVLEKGKQLLGNASGYVGEASGEDTVIKFTSEVSPNLQEVTEKMSATFAIDQVDVKATGPPKASLKLVAKSEAAAKEIVAKIEEAVAPMKDMMEMMGVDPKFVCAGPVVEICMSPPEGFMDQFYSEEDMMRTLTPLIKALKQSNAKVTWANEYDDILAKPDTPMPEIFKGCRVYLELFAMAKGKRLFADTVLTLMEDKMGGAETGKVISELADMFSGVEIVQNIGFHPAHLASLMKCESGMLEMIMPAMTPSGAREMIASMLPIEMMPAEEIKPFVDAGVYVLDRLEGVDSVGITNIDLPVEFAANGLPATVGATLTGNNIKPFSLFKYILEPSIEKFNAAAGA
jgi:Ca2+-binding EF-hand superfamily protein